MLLFFVFFNIAFEDNTGKVGRLGQWRIWKAS